MPAARLRVRDALGNWVVAVDHSPFKIGRRETNDVQLGGAEVSREHAEIIVDHDRFLLRDCRSRYGTFLDGEAVTERELQSGDQIRLGQGGGADLVFLTGDDDSPETGVITAAIARSGLREMTELLARLRALGSGRLLQDVLTLVVDAALEISGAERGFILLATSQGGLEFRLARGRAGRPLTDLTFEISRISREVFKTGQTRVIRDLTARGDAEGHTATRNLGIRSIFCVPLNLVRFLESGEPSGHDRRIGVLYLDGQGKGRLLSAETQSTLETLATEASVAIENARLYRETLEKTRIEHELRIAAQIQRALLPQPTAGPSYLQVAAAAIPCRSIGGDFFDYLGRDGPVFGFTLGDVAGKGPPAALMSAMMQGMFAFAARGPFADNPASIVADINRALCDRALEERFVTLFFGVITPDGRVTYCNGGHNPPFVIGASGVRRLTSGGPVVGLLEGVGYEQETITLQPGDTIVVYSDGVSEARNGAGDEFGEPRLLETIQRIGTTNAEALVDGVIDAVRGFTADTVQSDDITVMVVRYVGS